MRPRARCVLGLSLACVIGCSQATPSRSSAPSPLVVTSPGAQPSSSEPPTDTWRVDLEYTYWQARPGAIAVDATGVYITGPVLDTTNSAVRRWAVAKLDRATGAPLWNVFDDPGNGPMPEHMVLGPGLLIVAGHESNYAKERSLVFERRDPANGALVWRRRMPETRSGKYSLGGIALRPNVLLFAATNERGRPTAVFGELALDTGKPTGARVMRNDRRGRHIAGDASGFYLLGDNSRNQFVLEKLDSQWRTLSTSNAGSVLRMERDTTGLVAWFRNIDEYDPDGKRVWTSPLVGDFVDVAIDDTGIYACAMMDASKQAYFAIAKLDPANGNVMWSTRTAAYEESRPSSAIAVDGDAIYILGYLGDRWYVERRRKSDGALGNVKPTLHALDTKTAPQIAR